MFSRQVVLVILAVITLIQYILTDNGPFLLKKTIQFPNQTYPTTWAIKDNDQILAFSYTINKSINKSKKQSNQEQKSLNGQQEYINNQYKSSLYYAYSGDLFEKSIHNYSYPYGQFNSQYYSNTAIFASQGQTIQSYSYLNQTTWQIKGVYKMLSVGNQRQIFSKSNNQTNCSSLLIMDQYQNISKQIVYESPTQCNDKNGGLLLDLNNGLIAHARYDAVFILNITNQSPIVQCINVTGTQRYQIEISNIDKFYNKSNHDSMFYITTNYGYNYSTYIYDKENKNYSKLGEFLHYGTGCKFTDINTCQSLLGSKLLLNSNVHKQIIKLNQSSIPYTNPFINTTLYGVSDNSTMTVGYNYYSNKLVIYKLNEYNEIILSQQMNLASNLHCITNAKFSDKDQYIFIQTSNCSNSNNSNICLVDIQHKLTNCITQQSTNNIYNRTGGATINQSYIINLKRQIIVAWKFNSNSFLIQSRNADDLSLAQTLQWKFNDTQSKIINIRIIHNLQWKHKFAVLAHTTNKNYFHIFGLVSKDQKNVSAKIQYTGISSQKISIYHSQPYHDGIASFDTKGNSTTQCQLNIFGPELKQQEAKKFNYDCKDFRKPYRILVENHFDWVCLQGLDAISNLYYLTDCYKIQLIANDGSNNKNNNDIANDGNNSGDNQYIEKITRRSMFLQNMRTINGDYIKPIIMGKQNILIEYGQGSIQRFILHNVSTIPLFMAQLPHQVNQSYFSYHYQYDNQFAYFNPISSKKSSNQVLAFTEYNRLRIFRNSSQQFKQLQKKNHPNQYAIKMQSYTIYSQNLSNIPYYSKTFPADTGQHLFSVIYNNQTYQSIIKFIQMNGEFKGKIIWNTSQEKPPVIYIDMGDNQFASLVKNDSIKSKPFTYKDKVQNYQDATTARFGKMYVTDDTNLLFIMENNGQAIPYYKQSVLKSDYKIIGKTVFEQVKNAIISQSKKQFLIQNKQNIYNIGYKQIQINEHMIRKDEKFIQMYIVDQQKIHLISNKINSSKQQIINKKKKIKLANKNNNQIQKNNLISQSNQLSKGANSQLSKITNKYYSHFIKSIQNNYQSNSIQDNKKIINPNHQQKSHKQSLQSRVDQTIIIRYQNYTKFCTLNFTICTDIYDIKGDSPFAGSSNGNYIAYVWINQNKSQIVHIMQIISQGQRISVQNITLPSLPRTDNSNMYIPIIQQLYFSPNNTLYAMTISGKGQVPIIVYVYSRQSCNINTQTLKDGKCQCNQNYVPVPKSKPGSVIVQKYVCQCPIWNDFTFDQNSNICYCDSNKIIRSDQRNEDFCDHSSEWWKILLIILGAIVLIFIILSIIGYNKYQRLKQKYNQTQINKAGITKCRFIFLFVWCNPPDIGQSLIHDEDDVSIINGPNGVRVNGSQMRRQKNQADKEINLLNNKIDRQIDYKGGNNKDDIQIKNIIVNIIQQKGQQKKRKLTEQKQKLNRQKKQLFKNKIKKKSQSEINQRSRYSEFEQQQQQ